MMAADRRSGIARHAGPGPFCQAGQDDQGTGAHHGSAGDQWGAWNCGPLLRLPLLFMAASLFRDVLNTVAPDDAEIIRTG